MRFVFTFVALLAADLSQADKLEIYRQLAGNFRPWALTHYPAFADLSTRLFVIPEFRRTPLDARRLLVP